MVNYEIVRTWPNLYPDRVDALYCNMTKAEAEQKAAEIQMHCDLNDVPCVITARKERP